MAMLAVDQPDSLEDWVAIKENPFLAKSSTKNKLVFHVAWNDVEGKIAVTCRRCGDSSDLASPGAWTAAFTFSEISGIHEQLCLVHPSLSQYLPCLPVEPRGLWAYFVTQDAPPDESIGVEIHRYLDIVLEICGEHLLVSTLFEEHSTDAYFEKISELRRRSFDEAVSRAEEQLESVLFLSEGSINMLEMADVYRHEDEVLLKWNVAWAELYNYLIQPFLDSRELAFNKLREAKAGLDSRSLGSRRKAEYQAMFIDWRQEYNRILDSIQELYIHYYERTVTILSASRERMLRHKECFGAKSFESIAFERLVQISERLSSERLQLLQNRRKHFENQRDKIKQQIAELDAGNPCVHDDLATLEKSAYEWQLKVFDVHIDLLSEDELGVRTSIDAIRQQLAAAASEVYFYDAVESLDDLSASAANDCDDDDDECCHSTARTQLTRLQARLVSICQRKAAFRNRKTRLISEKQLKIQRRAEDEQRQRKHHCIQLKRAEQKVEETEKRDFIDAERRKTIERLRLYKLKRAMPRTIRPSALSSASRRPTIPVSRNSDTSDQQQHFTNPPTATSTTGATQVPSPSSSRPLTPSPALADSSNHLEPGSTIPPPPPLPPPPPPAFPGPGKLPDANSADPGRSLCPPGPAPVLTSVPDRPPRRNGNSETVVSGVDLSSIETARLRLKKAADLTDTSMSCSSRPLVTTSELLRQRSNLRPVRPDDETTLSAPARSTTASPVRLAVPSDDHLRLLRDALDRIKKSSAADSDEDDSCDYSNDDFLD